MEKYYAINGKNTICKVLNYFNKWIQLTNKVANTIIKIIVKKLYNIIKIIY